MTPKEQKQWANTILSDHLADGIEYLTVSEILGFEEVKYSEEDLEYIYDLVSNKLANLSLEAKVDN